MSRSCRIAALFLPLAACGGPRPAVVPTHLGVDQAEESRVASDPAALARIAQASESSGDHAASAAFYGRAAALAPRDPAYAIGQARALSEQNETGLAINVLTDSRRHNPDDERLAATLGRLLVVSHRTAEAVALFRAALAPHPRSARLLVGLGVALDSENDPAGAQNAYRQALAVDPPNVAAANDLALSMAIAGRSEDALAALQTLRARVAEGGGSSATLATIDGNLALIYSMRGDLPHAEESGSRAVSPSDLESNLKFYSALGPSGADEVSGLPPAPPPAPLAEPPPAPASP